jgi:hypothetical protein
LLAYSQLIIGSKFLFINFIIGAKMTNTTPTSIDTQALTDTQVALTTLTLTYGDLYAKLVTAFRLAEALLRSPHEPVFTAKEIHKEIVGLMNVSAAKLKM